MEVSCAQLEGYGSDASERLELENKYAPLMRRDESFGPLVTYVPNKQLPLLGLYRYKEAFAYALVERLIDELQIGSSDFLFDPFLGMGTTCFTGLTHGIDSAGMDRLPVAVFAARTLCKALTQRPGEIADWYSRIREQVGSAQPAEMADDVPIIAKAFPEDLLRRLRQWKTVIGQVPGDARDLLMLMLLRALEPCSHASNDGQFLRLKPNKRLRWPDEVIGEGVQLLESDLQRAPLFWGDMGQKPGTAADIREGDARLAAAEWSRCSVSAIITSPPYPNRYDYTRSYALELCFAFVGNREELNNLRHSLLRSHIEAKTLPREVSPHPALSEVLARLERANLNNPRIPYMLLGYFVDMADAIQQWARLCTLDASAVVVVDNVRFHSQVVPVDLILCELAGMVGFKTEQIIVSRYKGNSSQQMGRYGRRPVRESILIWRKQ